MKSKNLIVSALLALAAVASAQAATITAGLNDVILGFTKSSSTGSTSNVEARLGAITDFKSGGTYATGSEVFLSQLSLAADLNAIYGTGTGSAGWKSSATTWAVVGTNGAGGGNTLWGTQTIAESPGSSQGTGANLISTAYAGLNNTTSTANSNVTTVISTAASNSWKNTSVVNFSYWANSIFRNNSVLASAGPATIGFYEYVETNTPDTAATFLGTFKLYSDGGFSFTSPIPEPSTYAAILGVATLGFAALRRRKQNALVA